MKLNTLPKAIALPYSETAIIENFIDIISVPAFIVQVDGKSFTYQKINQTLLDLIQVPCELIEGKTPHECLPDDMASIFENKYRKCITNRKPVTFEAEISLHGKKIWWNTTLSPEFDTNGEVCKIIGITHDTTTDRLREFTAAGNVANLEKVNENVTLFSTMAAHDIRAPLRKIQTLMQFAIEENEGTTQEALAYMKKTKQISADALEYVDDILSYARTLKVTPKSEDIVPVDQMLLELAEAIDPDELVQFMLPEACQITGEQAVLQVILRNLIENSTRHGSENIRVDVERDTSSIGFLKFTVSDDGYGFQDGAAGFIDCLKRLQITHKNRGFGLSAIHHLVNTRNGKLWLDKPASRYSTSIAFTLPGILVDGVKTLKVPDILTARSANGEFWKIPVNEVSRPL